MKKKIISAFLITLLSLNLVGCGETVKNTYGEEVQKYGPYIEISHDIGKDCTGDDLIFYTVYNKNTKEMFEIVDGYHAISIRQIWDYDEEGHPIVKYYEGE